MPVVTVIQYDLWRVFEKECNPKCIKWEPQSGKIQLEITADLYKELQKDPLLHAKLWEAASDPYKKFIARCKADFVKADKELLLKKRLQTANSDLFHKEVEVTMKRLGKGILGALNEMELEVRREVETAWKKLSERNASYRKYKIKALVFSSLKIGSLGFAIAALSNPITIGPALLTIQTLLSKSVSGFQEISKISQSAGKFRKMVEEDIQKLESGFKAHSRGFVSSQELGKSVFKTLFGYDFKTVSVCEKNLGQYREKLTGVDQKSHKLAKDLGRALDQMDELKKQAPQKLERDLASLEGNVNGLIVSVISIQEQVKEGDAWIEKQKPLLEELGKEKYPAVNYLEKIFATAMLVTKIVADYADLEKLAESACKQASHGVKIANGMHQTWQIWKKKEKANNKVITA